MWIPTLIHKQIEPVIGDEIAYTAQRAVIDRNGTEIEKPVHVYREYRQDEEGNIDPNQHIQLKNILVSDNENPEAYMELTLLQEGVTIKDRKEEPEEKQQEEKECYIPKRHILIKARSVTGHQDELFLKCLDARRNGLFLYEYECPKEKKYLLNSKNEITNAVYHAVKAFYHEHEYHDPNKDSLLPPFPCENPVDLTSPNNPALLHYLEKFEQIFLDELELIKEFKIECNINYARANKEKDALIEEKKQKEEAKEKIREEWAQEYQDTITLMQRVLLDNGYRRCLNYCSRVLSIHVYYQSLFYSKYNKLFDLRPHYHPLTYDFRKQWPSGKIDSSIIRLIPFHEEESTDCKIAYKKAINIHTAIEIIRIQKREIANLINCEYNKIINVQSASIFDLTENSSKISSSLTKRTAIMGILAGIASSALFFGLSKSCTYSPSQEYYNANDSIRDTILQHIKNQNTILQQQQESIDNLKTFIIEQNKAKPISKKR